jgi:hypothetical protein
MCPHTPHWSPSTVDKKALTSVERRHYLYDFHEAFINGAQLDRVSNKPLPNYRVQYDKGKNASARTGRTFDGGKIPGIQPVR